MSWTQFRKSETGLKARRWARQFSIIFVIWTASGLLAAIQWYMPMRASHHSLTLLHFLMPSLLMRWIFALLTPGVLWFSARFPFGHGRWLRTLGWHVIGATAFLILCVSIRGPFYPMTDPLMRNHSAWSWRLYHDMILQDALYDGMMYGTIVTISQLWESYRKYRERELRASRLEAELAQTELKVLKMQLDPHFLFATLRSVCDLIHRDVEAADDLVASLSELLRISLDAADEQEVTLKREIDYLNSYLEIQQIRFRNRLVVLVKIDPRSLDALVPNMIIPALVENLLRRGFEEVNWAGKVEILSEVRDRKLRIEIRDDLPQSGDGEERLPRSDLGLANAKARLVRLYGSSQDLTLGLNAPGGSYLRLEIPLIMTLGQPAELPAGQPLFEES